MVKEQRFDHILTTLKVAEMVTYDSLAQTLNVSEDTIRRDIEILHKNGLLSKVRGGAILRAKNPLTFQDRSSYLKKGKDVIALKVQQFVKSGQTIFMDGGTTICAVASQFPLNASFRVVTNNQALVPILAKNSGIEIVVLGGIYHRDTETNIGAKTCQEVASYIADIYFMGACAADPIYGITASVREDGEVKQSMANAAAKTMVLSNHEKLNHYDFFKVCNLSAIDALITDLPGEDERLDAFRNKNIHII
ncbi:DeoR/GlpR family DNA-binding transcription regulator [Olivibacter sp. CPCC 100613]|uniref:DeoR/GlpR family DNA-binding transcription regulator n=1 Tax=Olivibacter sp. CPCC 100613 TaxID=3079931 RepID=UPI002FFD1297